MDWTQHAFLKFQVCLSTMGSLEGSHATSPIFHPPAPRQVPRQVPLAGARFRKPWKVIPSRRSLLSVMEQKWPREDARAFQMTVAPWVRWERRGYWRGPLYLWGLLSLRQNLNWASGCNKKENNNCKALVRECGIECLRWAAGPTVGGESL